MLSRADTAVEDFRIVEAFCAVENIRTAELKSEQKEQRSDFLQISCISPSSTSRLICMSTYLRKSIRTQVLQSISLSDYPAVPAGRSVCKRLKSTSPKSAVWGFSHQTTQPITLNYSKGHDYKALPQFPLQLTGINEAVAHKSPGRRRSMSPCNVDAVSVPRIRRVHGLDAKICKNPKQLNPWNLGERRTRC